MTVWVVVQEDIEQHPKFGKVPLHKVLWDFGMDTNRYYEPDGRELFAGQLISEDNGNQHGYTHRSPFTGKICLGLRYVGVAREDGAMGRWIDRFLDSPLDENRKNRPKFSSKR